jgi:hypothetical protein
MLRQASAPEVSGAATSLWLEEAFLSSGVFSSAAAAGDLLPDLYY